MLQFCGDIPQNQTAPPQVYRVVREMLPRLRFGPEELLQWLDIVQQRNERARRSHRKRRAIRYAPVGVPP